MYRKSFGKDTPYGVQTNLKNTKKALKNIRYTHTHTLAHINVHIHYTKNSDTWAHVITQFTWSYFYNYIRYTWLGSDVEISSANDKQGLYILQEEQLTGSLLPHTSHGFLISQISIATWNSNVCLKWFLELNKIVLTFLCRPLPTGWQYTVPDVSG